MSKDRDKNKKNLAGPPEDTSAEDKQFGGGALFKFADLEDGESFQKAHNSSPPPVNKTSAPKSEVELEIFSKKTSPPSDHEAAQSSDGSEESESDQKVLRFYSENSSTNSAARMIKKGLQFVKDTFGGNQELKLEKPLSVQSPQAVKHSRSTRPIQSHVTNLSAHPSLLMSRRRKPVKKTKNRPTFLLLAALVSIALGWVVFSFLTTDKPGDLLTKPERTNVLNEFKSGISESRALRMIESSLHEKDCAGLTRNAQRVPTVIKNNDRYLAPTIACFLAMYDSGRAVEFANAVPARLLNLFNLERSQKFNQLVQSYLLYLHLLIENGRFQDAIETSARHCKIWSYEKVCVARFFVQASTGQIKSAAKAIFLLKGAKDNSPSFDAMIYHWAGARLAKKRGNHNLSNKRYRLAISSAPSDAFAFKKLIYDSWMESLFLRRDLTLLNTVKRRAITELSYFDSKFFDKYHLFSTLLNPTVNSEELASFLKDPFAISWIKKDYRLVAGMGGLALRSGFADHYDSIIKQSYQFHSKNSRNSRSIKQILNVWYIRTQFARSRASDVLRLSDQHLKLYGESAVIRHLKGSVYIAQGGQTSLQMATKEFRMGLKRSITWQSLFGTGLALTRLGQFKEAEKVTKRLSRMRLTLEGQKWRDLLKAEMTFRKGKLKESLVLLEQIVKRDPQFISALNLQIKVLKQLGEDDLAQQKNITTTAILQENSYLKISEGITSPLGPLVFTRL